MTYIKDFLCLKDNFPSQEVAQSHYVKIGKIITVILMIFSAFFAVKMQSVSKAWGIYFFHGCWHWLGTNTKVVLVED